MNDGQTSARYWYIAPVQDGECAIARVYRCVPLACDAIARRTPWFYGGSRGLRGDGQWRPWGEKFAVLGAGARFLSSLSGNGGNWGFWVWFGDF